MVIPSLSRRAIKNQSVLGHAKERRRVAKEIGRRVNGCLGFGVASSAYYWLVQLVLYRRLDTEGYSLDGMRTGSHYSSDG